MCGMLCKNVVNKCRKNSQLNFKQIIDCIMYDEWNRVLGKDIHGNNKECQWIRNYREHICKYIFFQDKTKLNEITSNERRAANL